VLTSLRTFFNYNFMDLKSGFKYLGYFIKDQKSTFDEWRWLIIKFEKRIKHWCNRWLTLGGCCILAKSVLESQAVYWMALAVVPTSVLTRIRQLIYDFLWSGVIKIKVYMFVIGAF
jgi:hypothetical protein